MRKYLYNYNQMREIVWIIPSSWSASRVHVGDAVTKWLADFGSRSAGSGPGRVIVLCSWAKHLLSQYLSPPRSINGYQQTARETWRNVGRLPAKG